MRLSLIESQIKGMSAHRLAYFAGLLSMYLGLKRTVLAIDCLNSTSDQPADQQEYFRRFVCILGIEVNDTQWDLAVEALQRVMPPQTEEAHVDQEKTSK